MKTAVYLRVSTLDQEKGIQSQEAAVKQYLENHKLHNVQWFRDRLSGKDLNRPDFAKMQRAIFNGQVDTVVVWKLDRISRSLRDGIAVLCDWLERGVRVICISQQLDFSGIQGKMFASLLFALAEMERENLRENTKRGLASARAKGIRLGRPTKVDASAVQSLRAGGLSVVAIAERLGVTKPTIYKALRGSAGVAAL